MYLFFQCVAEAIAEKGLRGVAEMVPGGGAMFDIAESVWRKYRDRRRESEQRNEIQQLAHATFEEAKQAAIEAANKAAAGQPEMLPSLELYLTQIPATIRQSLKRADDPTGKTVPANFAIRSAEDVAKLLPTAMPRFRPGDPLPGKAGWVLERQLGVGGFGEVWLARHPKFHSLTGAVKFCRNLQTRDRDMLHESKVIDRVLSQGSHANIVKLLDVHLDADPPWLMYEYVEAGDLADLIHQWAGLPITERAEAIVALRELAMTIAHFHGLQPAIVHRDLKPANILRDRLGRLRITDFGISGIAARQIIENETRSTTTRAGRLQSYLYGSHTPLYASPQQRDGAEPDPRDDVHALGVIAYQMLTGQMTQGVGPDFAEDLKDAGINAEFIELLRRCTAQKIDRRPRNGAEVAACLGQLSFQKRRDEPIPMAVAAPATSIQVQVNDTSQRESSWAGIVREIVSDPIEKTAFINQARAFLQTLSRTEKNIDDTHVLSIVLPGVFGTGAVLGIAIPTIVTGFLPVWLGIGIGLCAGAIITGCFLLLLWIIRSIQKSKQDHAVEMFATAYPELIDSCGGTNRFRNKALIQSILDSVDDLPKPGFFDRWFGS